VLRRDAVAPGTGLESSGGLTLAVAGDYARTGVDFVAVGALTHSVTVLDLGLDLD
jgi:nicotinate-nucleotide pyrophosphorylase (carboxylating)